MDVITSHLYKVDMSRTQLCKLLHISTMTLNTYCKDFELIPTRNIIKMSAIFRIPAEQLLYEFINNRVIMKPKDVWYLENIRANVRGKA